MEQFLNSFYANNARKLHRMVDKILRKFGGIYDKDRDDFYSVANKVMCEVSKSYDYVQDFDAYVYSCLKNNIMTEMTRRNRLKRKTGRQYLWIFP